MDSYNELLKERQVTYKPADVGRVLTDSDADRARSYIHDQKTRKMTEQVTAVQKVVAEIISVGDYSSVLVINGLADLLHPCQVLADLFSIRDKK